MATPSANGRPRMVPRSRSRSVRFPRMNSFDKSSSQQQEDDLTWALAVALGTESPVKPKKSSGPTMHAETGPSPQSLNYKLLCSKLEAYRIQENRRKSAPPPRPSTKGVYVPRNAANQFSVTATPIDDALKLSQAQVTTSRRSRRSSFVTRPKGPNPRFSSAGYPTVIGKGPPDSRQIYATIQIDLPEGKYLPVGKRAPDSKSSSTSSKQRSSRTIEGSRTTLGRYRPGDAARRQVGVLTPHDESDESSSPSHDYRGGRYRLNDMPYDLPEPEDGQHTPDSGPRPRPQLYDRNDWTQKSQAASIRKLSTDHSSHSSHPRSKTKPSPNMISDAVKKIKQEEKLRKRKSIFGLFQKS